MIFVIRLTRQYERKRRKPTTRLPRPIRLRLTLFPRGPSVTTPLRPRTAWEQQVFDLIKKWFGKYRPGYAFELLDWQGSGYLGLWAVSVFLIPPSKADRTKLIEPRRLKPEDLRVEAMPGALDKR